MKVEYFQSVGHLRYETRSGFVVEAVGSALPVFNSIDSAIDWYDFGPMELGGPGSTYEITWSDTDPVYQADLCSGFPLQTVYFGEGARPVADAETATAQWFGEDSTAVWWAVNDSRYSVPDIYISSSIADLNQRSRSWFETRDREIVGHKANVAISISTSDKERIELAAKDHTVHFESMTLSREHSSVDLFSTVTNGLNQYGWRIWLHSSKSSNGSSSFSSRLTSARQPRPFVAVGFTSKN
jgi:hypothetical protein